MNDMYSDKRVFRKNLIEKRKKTSEGKAENDTLIYNLLINSDMFKNSKSVLTYISKDFEVDTIRLVNHCFEIEKQVAAPQCNGDEMNFRIIRDISQLHKSAFGVYEPIDSCAVLTEFTNTICVVPGLSFSKNGMRIGYGRGFYDRFLKNYSDISIGLCYGDFIGEVPYERHDIAVDIIITENSIIYCKTA